MILNHFNLESEWDSYYHILNEYLLEVCTEEEYQEFRTIYPEASYREMMIGLTKRVLNPFHICKIVENDNLVGFVDYVCFVDEEGKALIGNFYLRPELRAHGLGSQVYQLVEAQLQSLGAKYIDVTPSAKAISFYLRHGFIETSDHSLENDEIVYRKFLI